MIYTYVCGGGGSGETNALPINNSQLRILPNDCHAWQPLGFICIGLLVIIRIFIIALNYSKLKGTFIICRGVLLHKSG